MPAVYYNNAEQKAAQKPQGYDYNAVILRGTQGIWQLHSVKEYKDEKFGKPQYGYMRFRYVFVHLKPGAEKAVTEEAQNRFRGMGHGKFLSIEVDPVCTPPRLSDKGETLKPSKMFEVHRILLNDGDPLTPEQLGAETSEKFNLAMGLPATASFKDWQAAYNKASDAGDDATMARLSGMTLEEFRQVPAEANIRSHVTGERVIKGRYAAAVLSITITELAKSRIQVYATPETKTALKTGRKYNTLRKLDQLVEPEARIEGGWKPFEKPYDEREADDDPDLNCAVCGKHTRGYERRVDKRWVSNREAAQGSIEKFGKVLCGVHFKAALENGAEETEDEE